MSESRQPGPAGKDRRQTTPASASHPVTSTAAAPKREVASREMQFMIGHRTSANALPLNKAIPRYDANLLVEALAALPDVTVVRRVRPTSLAVLSTGARASRDVVVVRTSTHERARYLTNSAIGNPSVIVERDQLLRHMDSVRPPLGLAPRGPTQIATASVPVTFFVSDGNARPVAGADVVLYGSNGTEDQGKTDAGGEATIEFSGGFLNEVAALYVKPAANYWEVFIERPHLDDKVINTVALEPLNAFPRARFPGVSGQPFLGWGQRLMGLLGLDAKELDGHGVRVAIIDSGCDTDHPALSHITIGRDYTNLDNDHEPSERTWRSDVMSHGTHCAGVIAGNGAPGHIRGFAPKAEIHILKVFPGGAFNNLIAAINYCVDHQIHVVNCSLGGDVGSELVTQAIQHAREAGVAVCVAAGNSAGSVQFPANVAGVLSVSALGQAGNFPPFTYHAHTVPDGATVVDGQVFPAKFSCHGPEIGVCGPGVAIISSVPGGGYAAWDGTSMADPHVTGIAALLAAHHPDLAGVPTRDAAWVDRLFSILRGATEQVGLSPEYGGAGLPVVGKAVTGTVPDIATTPSVPEGRLSAKIISDIVNAVQAALTTPSVDPTQAVNGRADLLKPIIAD